MPTRKLIESTLGAITVAGDLGNWRIAAASELPEPGLELIRLAFSAPEAAAPPHVVLQFGTPQIDMHTRWHPEGRFDRNIPPNWGAAVRSSLPISVPLMQTLSLQGENRVLAALSDAMRQVEIKCGVNEVTNEVEFRFDLFSVPEAPIAACELVLRLDTRKIFYADAVRAAMAWYAAMPEYAPAPAPEAAFDPVYSTWYSYHKAISARDVEEECALAVRYGMKSVILDDGWQIDDAREATGAYSLCGDWEISRKRFPDMRRHVANIHALGMKYLVWYAVPFIGEKSKNFARFESKYLYRIARLSCRVLDPRFPEVREFLIGTYETALKAWDIDGFKLDFIDCFHFEGEDPAVRENYAGRDIRSLPAAVDRLLSDVMARLRKIRPDILIEFRQRYIGPAMRKYGNMFRAADCPADVHANRNRILDLRLTSGNTAVHSDMLEWNVGDSPENAALQLLGILFGVPQISVRLAGISDLHRKMLRFWLDFWTRHRAVLMNGELKPYHPEVNYPVVTAENDTEKVIAVYQPDLCVDVECVPGKTCYVINATGRAGLVLDLKFAPASAKLFDTMGNPIPCPAPGTALTCVPVPASGLIELQSKT